MAVAELYFWAERKRHAWAQLGAAAALGLASLLMLLGIVGATLLMRGPRLRETAGHVFAW